MRGTYTEDHRTVPEAVVPVAASQHFRDILHVPGYLRVRTPLEPVESTDIYITIHDGSKITVPK